VNVQQRCEGVSKSMRQDEAYDVHVFILGNPRRVTSMYKGIQGYQAFRLPCIPPFPMRQDVEPLLLV
jgi:hypothetical protein